MEHSGDHGGDPLEPVRLKIADVIGALMELWGFRRLLGRTWAVLYLSEEPLTAAELQRVLQISAGSASMTLTELQKWGVVKKTWVPGDRRDHYQPETSVWKMVSRVFRERELRHVRDAVEAFQGALDALAALPAAQRQGAALFLEERVRRLLTLAEIGRGLIEMVLAGRLSEAPPLPEVLEGAAR